MTVVEGWFGGIKYDRVPAANELPAADLELIKANAAINSQASAVMLSICTLLNIDIPPQPFKHSHGTAAIMQQHQ